MTVGDLAARSGVPAKTLRYYEEIGLLVPGRTRAGWRNYDESALVVLQLTTVGKRLGLDLASITALVRSFADPRVPTEDLIRALEPHRRRLDAEVKALREARKLLDALVDDCPFRRG